MRSRSASESSARLALLKLIGLFTNLFFFQRWSTAFASPADHALGPLVILVPVVGALIIGFMARYGSDRIWGHGIPEAIEAILIALDDLLKARALNLEAERRPRARAQLHISVCLQRRHDRHRR